MMLLKGPVCVCVCYCTFVCKLSKNSNISAYYCFVNMFHDDYYAKNIENLHKFTWIICKCISSVYLQAVCIHCICIFICLSCLPVVCMLMSKACRPQTTHCKNDSLVSCFVFRPTVLSVFLDTYLWSNYLPALADMNHSDLSQENISNH